jgi:Glycosyl transferase family 2
LLLNDHMNTLAQLSIIIPFAPDDMAWKSLLNDLITLPKSSEIILVAANEQDALNAELFIGMLTNQKTRVTPAQAGAQSLGSSAPTPMASCLHGEDNLNQPLLKITVISSAKGRSIQMNTGAKMAKNSCLWFLHADSRVDQNCLKAIDRFDFHKPQLAYFGLRFLNDGPGRMGINRFGVWFRSRFLRLPFGDQGFVIAKSNFEKLGCYREDLHKGEDHALVWCARKNGIKLKALSASIHTSARKYARHGWGATTRTHLRETWLQAKEFSKQAKT